MQQNKRYGYSSGSGRRDPQTQTPADNCICTKQPVSLAMAYVSDQPFGKTYGADEALSRGTLFPALYMPYGGGCGR